jgi:hypothetical protein
MALTRRPGTALSAMSERAYVAIRIAASADLRRLALRLDWRGVPVEVLERVVMHTGHHRERPEGSIGRM